MVQRKRTRPAVAGGGGAYQWVWDWYEQDHRAWAESVHGRVPGARYPKTYLLGKLRRGEPVAVEAGFLPPEFGGVPRPRTKVEADGRSEQAKRAARSMVTVHPDGRVVSAGPGGADELDVFDEFRNL